LAQPHQLMQPFDATYPFGPDVNISNDYTSGRVSVIIPTYNYGQFIAGAIESAIEQNIPDTEIIVVDDGSTDGTCDKIADYNSRIIYIYQNNAGQSAARNTGLLNCTGEFIQFLDADDILGPSKIVSQLDYFSRNRDSFIVVCPNKLFNGFSRNGQPRVIGSLPLYRENIDLHLCYFNIAPPHAFLFRRNVIVHTGLFDSTVDNCEDYDLLLRAAAKGFIPHYAPNGTVYYRRHLKSITANSTRQFNTDAVLHRRLSNLFDQYQNFPANNKFLGFLAFSAGAILTASRLYDHKKEDAIDLIELAQMRINDAKEIALSKQYEWDIFTNLFYFRIMSCLAYPCFRGSTFKASITESLQEILAASNAAVSKPYLVANALRSALIGPHRSIWERRELGRLTLKYLRNSFFEFCFNHFRQ